MTPTIQGFIYLAVFMIIVGLVGLGVVKGFEDSELKKGEKCQD